MKDLRGEVFSKLKGSFFFCVNLQEKIKGIAKTYNIKIRVNFNDALRWRG